MEIKSEWIIEKLKKKKKRRSDSEPKMRYFKTPICRIFSEKSKTIQSQKTYECRILGQKMGYDRRVKYVIKKLAQIHVFSLYKTSKKTSTYVSVFPQFLLR